MVVDVLTGEIRYPCVRVYDTEHRVVSDTERYPPPRMKVR